jgi:hypothetical protein
MDTINPIELEFIDFIRHNYVMVIRSTSVFYSAVSIKGDLYIVILVKKEVSHYWRYRYQQYNAYSLHMTVITLLSSSVR